MELEIFQIDAFTDKLFRGNSAGVCLLDNWLPDTTMQAIAMEKNLSETAFVVPKDTNYTIRWFTPTTEVKLCGHATLASAHVLLNEYNHPANTIAFDSLSGWLNTQSTAEGIELDFPLKEPQFIAKPNGLDCALGISVLETWATEEILVAILPSSEQVKSLKPDLAAIANFPYNGICIVAIDETHEFDFISRYFAPRIGIDEDPVTGSLYTILTPLFSRKLERTEFFVYQASSRGGRIATKINHDGSRVLITGTAVTVMRSVMYLDA